MSEIKAVLFDADGVLITPDKLFSVQYSEVNGYDPEEFQAFFRGVFSEAIEGRADLKDLIRENNHIWRWDKDPQELLDMWFSGENVIDQEVLAVAKDLKARHMPIYMATNQEKYRARYLKEVMFPDLFKGFFVSSEIGHMKRDPQFWVPVLGRLAADIPGIKPEEVVYFDDSQDSIDGALEASINAHLFTDVGVIRKALNHE